MLFQRIYYSIKPMMPRPLRVGMRQLRGRFMKWKHEGQWPILPISGRKPQGWPGWPGGKKFAVVLTHDVESASGVERVGHLAAIETELGFRSSFNFVPEAYSTPPSLRQRLQADGFEVGVHGLKHDGKLYNSRAIFRERALRINEYLKDWGAVGFRSPFMHHNLDWIHDLEIQYDMSTFDTDPFEIQNDGAETIFPFWVPKAGGEGGYMELPYTLVQDLTLFTILGQTDIEIWKRKIDWIVEQGGMVLVNVHPDYVHFDNSPFTDGEFPSNLYRELLEYIRDKYEGQYWHALPRDVAAYCREFKPVKPPVTGRRVCMLAYSHVEADNRILRYATALAHRGDQVDVLSLADDKPRPQKEVFHGLWVNRIQQRLHNEAGQSDYLVRLIKFCVRAAWVLARDRFRLGYDLIHVHNVPDFLVFATLIPRLTGTRIILDIHDIVPEFYESKFKSKGSSVVEVLKVVENLSASFAHHVIISNHLWYDKITDRSVSTDRCSTYINYVDLTVFSPRERERRSGPFTIIFPGGLQWHQGLDLAIRAFAEFRRKIPDSEFHVYGHGDQKPGLIALAAELGLSDSVKFFPPVSMHAVPRLIANADMGVVPKRANSFGNEAYSTKIMEFMSQGLPVVVSRTRIDTFYFSDREVRFFNSGDVEDLTRAMLEVAENPELRQRLVEGGRRYIAENCWGRRQEDYLRLVDNLIKPTLDI